jgi:beta-lactamase regulating signal transducer with metallopeptidase domain/tetratricopeptide (TPR) repeat protein
METISRYLLTFLVNSLWQIPLVAAIAWLACRCLGKSSASQWHAVWVAALAASLLLPAASIRRVLVDDDMFDPVVSQAETSAPVNLSTHNARQANKPEAPITLWMPRFTVSPVLGAYLFFVGLGLVRLARAVRRTIAIRRSAQVREIPAALARVQRRAQDALGVDRVELAFSPDVCGPVTAGGIIILPESLVAESSEDVLTTAIGHEMAHVARRDFALNIVYELLLLPISFQPAAWMIRRAIERTREMACDELVTRRLIDASAYARSILTIATAMTACPSPGYSLGVFDGDILEQRIRRLLERPAAHLKRARIVLVGGLTALAICVAVASSISFNARAQGTGSSVMLQGQEAFARGDYQTAAGRFDVAVRLEPDNLEAKLQLAKALMKQFVPGMDAASPLVVNARKQYADVLARDPGNKRALHGMMITAADVRNWHEAIEWAEKTVRADSGDASAYYTIGVADWAMTFSDYMKARQAAGMLPQDPGIIPDAGLRESVRTNHDSQIDDGLRALETAVKLNPDYSDAFAYTNLLLRIRAGIADSKALYDEYIAKADELVGQALAARKRQAQSGANPDPDRADSHLAAPPPPPPPPPPAGLSGTVPAITVEQAVQKTKLVRHVDPSGPVGITGTVNLRVIIATDGTVRNIQVLDGNPALVPASIDAVKRWLWQPTLLNGSSAEVVTVVTLSFGSH